MELSRQEYPAMLESLQPLQAVTLLNDRIRHVSKLNSDIADWLQERRRIEEQYALGLRKLARRQPPDEYSDLGTFSTPWQKIVTATETMAESHFLLSQRIDADVERSLRDFTSTNREMQSFGNISGNLSSLAKDIDNAQKKTDKLKEKGGKSSADKVATANTELDNAQSQWDSTAPYVFEKLQALDEARWNHLRDVLTQFQTHEVDQVERSRVSAESCLNSLLNVDTADEIKAYCLQSTEGRPKLTRKQSRPSTAGQSSLAPPQPQNRGAPEDASSQRSGSIQEQPSPARKGISGLKRLGTVIGRRRQSTIYGGNSATPERKSTSNLQHTFASFGRSRTRDKAPIPEEPPESLPIRESEDVPPSRGTAVTATSQADAAKKGSEESPTAEPVTVNGAQPEKSPTLQQPIEPEPLSPSTDAPRDTEGFSVPPSGLDPISQAEQEAAASSDAPGPQFKLAIRNAPIQEEEADAATALSSVQNALLAQAPSRKVGTIRGRRDVRNTVFIPNPPSFDTTPSESQLSGPSPAPLSPDLSIQAPSAAPLKAGQRPGLGDEPSASDTQSIRSGRSLASSASTSIKHPEMHRPGLNASVIETINAWFEKGEVTKAHVIGELALAFNPVDINSPFGTETIRLDNFPVLEKVAPNPTFVEQVADTPGKYVIDLSKITKASVAFKYQVHLEPEALAIYPPLLINPASRIQSSHTDVVVNCTSNPGFAHGSIPSATLNNVLIIVHFDPSAARPNSCKLQPAGHFNRERNLAYWRLNNFALAPGTQRKLRMRLAGDAEVRIANVEARWDISSGAAATAGSGLGVSALTEAAGAGGATTEGGEDHDPFADEDTEGEKKEEGAVAKPGWKAVEALRGFRSGTYVAN